MIASPEYEYRESPDGVHMFRSQSIWLGRDEVYRAAVITSYQL